LGLKLERRAENAALSLKQAFFKLDDGSSIEVCTPTDPNSAVGKALESRGEGIHSIVFKVADIPKTAADFKGRGVSMIGDTFVHPKSTHGMLVQLTDKD
jgi:4-hydroxyphenylpyruvate dioxygenase-like putative hemolysin